MTLALYPYQEEGSRFLADRLVAFLFDDMGVGKTIQAIVGCDLIGAERVLVLCPPVVRVNWLREFNKWQKAKRSISVAARRVDFTNAGIMNADVLIVGYPALAQKSVRDALKARAWNDVLICDEAQALKNPKAVVSRAVYGHRFDCNHGVAGTAVAAWIMTGTPIMNHPAEVWTHLHALAPDSLRPKAIRDAGRTLFGPDQPLNYKAFRGAMCILSEDGSVYHAAAHAKTTLPNLLRPLTLRRMLTDVVKDMPPLRWADVTVEPDVLPPMPDMTPEAQAVIAAATGRAQAGDDDGALDVLSADAMHLSTLRMWTGIAKAPAVADFVAAELDGGLDRCVVFAIHKGVIAILAERFGAACRVIDGSTSPSQRQASIDDFQYDRVQILILQLDAVSTGVTLTASANVLFAESSWVPAVMAQAAKRCHRIGQKRSVLARVFSLKGSLDESVNRVVARKAADISQIDLALSSQSIG